MQTANVQLKAKLSLWTTHLLHTNARDADEGSRNVRRDEKGYAIRSLRSGRCVVQ